MNAVVSETPQEEQRPELFAINGLPVDFTSVPKDFVCPALGEVDTDAGSAWMNPQIPLPERFELLRSYLKLVKSENAVLRAEQRGTSQLAGTQQARPTLSLNVGEEQSIALVIGSNETGKQVALGTAANVGEALEPQVVEITPGSDMHLSLLMSFEGLHLNSPQEHQELLSWGKRVWAAARSDAAAREPTAEAPKGAVVTGYHISCKDAAVMVFRPDEVNRTINALRLLWRNDPEDYTVAQAELAVCFPFSPKQFKKAAKTAKTPSDLLDAEAAHIYMAHPSTGEANWESLNEEERDHWREQAMRTMKFCHVQVAGSPAQLHKSTYLTGTQLRELFGIRYDHTLYLVRPGKPDRRLRNHDFVPASASLIQLRVYGPSNGG